MKVTVEFLSLPNVAKIAGSKSVEIDFVGRTTDDLLQAVVEKFGSEFRDFLLDESGKLDMKLRMMVNKKEWVISDQLGTHKLSEGDLVTIMMLVGGG